MCSIIGANYQICKDYCGKKNIANIKCSRSAYFIETLLTKFIAEDAPQNSAGLKVHPWSQSPRGFVQRLTCCHAGQVSHGEEAIINSLNCLEIRRPSACFYFVRCCPNSHRGLILLKCKLVGTLVHVRQCVCVHVRACVSGTKARLQWNRTRMGIMHCCFFSWRLSVYPCFNLALLSHCQHWSSSLTQPATCCMTTSLTLLVYFLVIWLLVSPCVSACPTKVRPCLGVPVFAKIRPNPSHSSASPVCYTHLFSARRLLSLPFWLSPIIFKSSKVVKGTLVLVVVKFAQHCGKAMVTALTVNLRFPRLKSVSSAEVEWIRFGTLDLFTVSGLHYRGSDPESKVAVKVPVGRGSWGQLKRSYWVLIWKSCDWHQTGCFPLTAPKVSPRSKQTGLVWTTSWLVSSISVARLVCKSMRNIKQRTRSTRHWGITHLSRQHAMTTTSQPRSRPPEDTGNNWFP